MVKDIEITKEYKEVEEKEITVIKCKIKDGEDKDILSIQEYSSLNVDTSEKTKKVDAKGVNTPSNYLKLMSLLNDLLK